MSRAACGPTTSWARLTELFVRHGPPSYLRSDNGPEFTATAMRSWLRRLGVTTLFIEPGRPWENGYVESFHGTLRDECLNPEIFTTLTEAQVLIERWRREYNQVRPHSARGSRPPAPDALEIGLPHPTPWAVRRGPVLTERVAQRSRAGHYDAGMVTRDDIHLDMFPAKSCCNCGFLSKFVCDAQTGENERSHVPITSQLERFHGLDEHNEAVWQGRRLARPQCWMRPGFLEREADGGAPSRATGTLAAIHLDRSKGAGDDYCREFTPWVPHLSFEQHWVERKLYLLERAREEWEAAREKGRQLFEEQLQKTSDAVQRYIAKIGIIGLLVAVLAIVIGAVVTAQCAGTTVVNEIAMPPQESARIVGGEGFVRQNISAQQRLERVAEEVRVFAVVEAPLHLIQIGR